MGIVGETYGQNNQNDPSFDFRWTSGNLVELVTKTSRPDTLMVRVVEYPNPIPPNPFIVNGKTIKINAQNTFSSLQNNGVRCLTLYQEHEYGDTTFIASAQDTVKLFPSLPNRIICDSKIRPLSIADADFFYIEALNYDTLFAMQVQVFLNNGKYRKTYTASRVRVMRYHYGGRMLTYLEDEKTKILSAIDSIDNNKSEDLNIQDFSGVDSAVISIKDSVASPLLIENTSYLENAKPSTFFSLFPGRKLYTLDLAPNALVAYETPWNEILSSSDGQSTFIYLHDFKLISSGGKVRIDWCKKGSNKVSSKDGIVLERYILLIEAGSVFNLNTDGSPIGKPEYSVYSEALLSRWWSGSTSLSLTSIRLPAAYDTVQKKQIPHIGNIGEGDLQARFSPYPSEWQPPEFSFIADLFFKTRAFGQTDNIETLPGIGLGFRIAILSFNDKRPAKEFGRSAGVLDIMLAEDNFWEQHERFIANFRIDVLSIASNNITISVRGKIDCPIKFPGPSDIRFSILSSVDVSVLSGVK